MTGEFWLSSMSAFPYLALCLVFVVGLALVEARGVILAYPRVGVMVSMFVVFLGFYFGRISALNSEAQTVFSSGMMALGVSVMAAVIIGSPVPKRHKWVMPEWRPAAEKRLQTLREQKDELESRKMPERHRRLKLKELYAQLMSVIEAMQRLEDKERRRGGDD